MKLFDYKNGQKCNGQKYISIVIFGIKITYTKNMNYLRRLKLITKLLRFKNKLFFTSKKYNYIVTFGRNCETASLLHRTHDCLDSTLFSFASSDENKKDVLLNAIINFDDIFTEEITFLREVNMWSCLKTNMFFHGSRDAKDFQGELNDDLQKEIEKEKQDTITKINYLREKNKKIYNSKEKKLYIYSLDINKSKDKIQEGIAYIKKLFSFLSGFDTNFDMVVIIKRDQYCEEIKQLEKEYKNIFIRKVCMFDEHLGQPVTLPFRYYNDWMNIFNEFQPLEKKVSKRRLKCDN